jgi:hypothetical protein
MKRYPVMSLGEYQRGEGRLACGRFAADGHVGADMLDRLKGADRPPELLARLGVLDGHVPRSLRNPDREGAEEQQSALMQLPVACGGPERRSRIHEPGTVQGDEIIHAAHRLHRDEVVSTEQCDGALVADEHPLGFGAIEQMNISVAARRQCNRAARIGDADARAAVNETRQRRLIELRKQLRSESQREDRGREEVPAELAVYQALLGGRQADAAGRFR